MSDFFFAFKCIILGIFGLFCIFFISYFILANDHVVTVYLNPIYATPKNFGTNAEFILPVWKLGAFSCVIGAIIATIFFQIGFYKKNTYIETLIKENASLKSKFDKVKTDISKCVT